MKLLAVLALAVCSLLVVQVVPATGKPDAAGGSINKQMAGGTAATLGQNPWVVGILADTTNFCHGSWITYNFMMTAASCVVGRTKFTLMIGALSFTNNKFEHGSNQYDTNITYVHPNYTASTKANNIALIKYINVMGNSGSLNQINLPKYSDATKTFEGTVATLSGWGTAVATGGSWSQTLQSASLNIVANSVCAASFSPYVFPSTMCTLTPNKGACSGDMGAPLVYKDAAGVWTQLGIMSLNGPNCTAYPQIYTRVSSYLPWIKSITNANIYP